MKSYKLHALASLAALVLSPTLMADTLLFDRGLPTANLNNAAGSNRSNVAWAEYTPDSNGDYWAVGDDFNLGMDGTYKIDTLRVWIVSSGDDPVSSMWSDLKLFGGTNGNIDLLSVVDTTIADPNISYSKVTYSDNTTYQGSSGGYIALWQIDFNLNWYVDGQTTYEFFIGDTPTALNISLYGNGVSPFVHSSNAALSGSNQQGADNMLRGLSWTESPTTITSEYTWTSLNYGWDKASDVNVQLYGTAVPVPTAAWTGLVLLGGLVARKGLRKISSR